MTRSRFVAPARTGQVRAVVFDVGETLVNETTEYQAWADWLGVPRHTFSAMFGAVIARGEDYRKVFQVFRPGFDLVSERQRRADAGKPESFGDSDLYPDARDCLATLKEQGYLVGIAGNQTDRAGGILRGLGFAADFIATPDDWHAEKPAPAFFEALIAECGVPAGEVASVGGRLDNDIRPALAAGLVTVLLRQCPWGYQHWDDPAARQSHIQVDSLAEIAGELARYNACQVG
jgi:FMN phosphatase YigB (HAD superfamily)